MSINGRPADWDSKDDHANTPTNEQKILVYSHKKSFYSFPPQYES